MLPLLLLIVTAASPDDVRFGQTFRQNGPQGVVATAKAIEKAKGAAAAVKALSLTLRNEDVELRAAAAHALGQMGDDGKRALPELIAALTKDEAGELAEALNDLDPGDIPIWLVERALRPDDASDAYQAVESLGLRDERVVPILEDGLSHPDFDVRWYAAVLLADMKSKAATARPALVQLLQEEPKREKRSGEFFSPSAVRAKAAFALGCIGAEPDET